MRHVAPLCVLLFAAGASASDSAVLDGIDLAPEGRWAGRFAFFATSPVTLDVGMPVGGALELHRRVGEGPLHAGLRASFSSTTEANASWELRHRHIAGGAVFGASWAFGVARPFAQAGAGVFHVRERARRHQYDRLVALNVSGLERTGSATGPLAWAEAGVAVQLRAGWQVVVAAGPTWTWLPGIGARAGLMAGVGGRHAF